MANQNSKKKTNTNNKKNNTKKENATKKVNNTNKKEVKKDNKKTVNNVKVTEEVKVEEEKVVSPKVTKEKNTFKLTSKQRDILLVILVAVVLIIALVLTGSKEPKLNIELPIALEGTTGFTEITYSEYEEKLGTEAPFVLVIVNEGCGYCEMYEPVVEKVANTYNLPINYINLANLTTEERTALNKSNTYLKKNQWGTPTTLFMYGNQVVESIGGYVDEETFVEFVKENFVVDTNE